MAVRFVDGGDVKVGRVVAVVYGPPGVGKTSLAFTAGKPVMFDFDEGVHRAVGSSGVPVVMARKWDDVAQLNAKDLDKFETVIVDTVGTCLEKLMMSITTGQPRLQDYGTLKTRFRMWLNLLKSAGKDVVLIAHGSEEQRGDDTVDRIVAMGSSKQEVYQQADLMGRLSFDALGQRVLSFDPTSASFGKNAGIDDTVIEDGSTGVLAEILAQAKANMNASASAASVQHEQLVDLREKLNVLEPKIDLFNAAGAELRKNSATEEEVHVLFSVAEAKGLTYDKEKKTFVFSNPEAEPEQEPAQPALAGS